MANENCPSCGQSLGAPLAFRGNASMTMHAKRDCSRCEKPLIWFSGSEELPEGWIIDEAAERQEQRASG